MAIPKHYSLQQLRMLNEQAGDFTEARPKKSNNPKDTLEYSQKYLDQLEANPMARAGWNPYLNVVLSEKDNPKGTGVMGLTRGKYEWSPYAISKSNVINDISPAMYKEIDSNYKDPKDRYEMVKNAIYINRAIFDPDAFDKEGYGPEGSKYTPVHEAMHRTNVLSKRMGKPIQKADDHPYIYLWQYRNSKTPKAKKAMAKRMKVVSEMSPEGMEVVYGAGLDEMQSKAAALFPKQAGNGRQLVNKVKSQFKSTRF